MKARRVDKMISILFLSSLFLPIIAYSNCEHHDCMNDECMRIFYRGKLGICVESAIDTMCLAMAVGVWFIAYGGAIVWSKQKNAVSPFVVMALVELLAVYLAFVDPSKWLFATSMLIPFVIVTIAGSIENKEKCRRKMMKPINYILFVAIVLLLSSCYSTFYQVYSTDAPNMGREGNALVHENSDLCAAYNFWSEGGNGSFAVYNKTDSDLFVVLPRSFLVRNGTPLDYFNGLKWERGSARITSESRSSEVSAYATVFGTLYGYGLYGYDGAISGAASYGMDISVSNADWSSVSMEEKPIICIPPRSMRVFNGYVFMDGLVDVSDRSQAYPEDRSTPVLYDYGDTPLRLVNRIAYSFDSDGSQVRHMENVFWISEIYNSKSSVSPCPGCFYNTYKGWWLDVKRSRRKETDRNHSR